MRNTLGWTAALFLAAAACNAAGTDTGKDTGLTTDGTGTTTTTTDEGGWCAVKKTFNGNCVVCHNATSLQGGLDLQTDPYTAIVGVEAFGFPGKTLVVANDSAGSLLYRKVAGTQAADEGGAMPVGTSLSATQLSEIQAWIDTGATDVCTGGTTPTQTGRHHSADFAEASVHGPAAKCQEETCTSCHGDDLSGGTTGISCDSCHDSDGDGAGDAGWRTDCVFCHGGADNLTGAPPVGIDGASAGLPFDEHTKHVTDTIHTAWDCTECHVKPVDVLTPGHVFVGDSTACKAETDFTAGLSPTAVWDGAMTCSDGYCHGNGLKTGAIDSGTTLDCAGCHADRHSSNADMNKQSGEHTLHAKTEGFGCETCHADVDKNDNIVDISVHVDGTPEVTISQLTWDPQKKTCDGTCHFERHNNRHW